MSDPFLITGPALISFSGGRTSAYMLWRILQAHGGTLPDDVLVVFANTGFEREETLRFIHECGTRWGVKVHWLEWKDREGRNVAAAERFDEVGLNSASRDGTPFGALVRRKRYPPNAVTRFCTAELKIDTMKQFMLSRGFTKWTNVVGLRYDEGHRVLKQLARNISGKERWQSVMPLSDAKVTRPTVMRFWLGDNQDPRHPDKPLPQGFDLGLRDYEGNCTYCFLKGRDVLEFEVREAIAPVDPWIGLEALALGATGDGARFVTEYSYQALKDNVERSPLLIPLDWQGLPPISDCTSDTCGGDTPAEIAALQSEFERSQ